MSVRTRDFESPASAIPPPGPFVEAGKRAADSYPVDGVVVNAVLGMLFSLSFDEESPMVQPIPEGMHSVTPALTVDGAAAAIDFLKRAFGAVELARAPDPSGT